MIRILILTKKRQIVITVDVISDEYRDQVRLATQVKSKLVPRDAVSAKVLIEQKNDGSVIANELKSGQVGQMYFDEKGFYIERRQKEHQFLK